MDFARRLVHRFPRPAPVEYPCCCRGSWHGFGSTVRFRDGTVVPALGQGSAGLGQGRHPEAAEEEALRTGLSLGMTLIDTAEIYGNGNAERLIGHVIAGQRDRVFLVSKVSPSHVAGDGIEQACDASLSCLRTDHLDLYLLHWPNGITDFSTVVIAFEKLVTAGKIRAWGVSNFKVSHMEALFHVPHGDHCPTNQVRYNLADREIERDVLPWCEQHKMPVMAYSPLGGSGASLLRDPTLARIGEARGCSAAAIALAWAIRSGTVVAIPESGSPAHVRENAVALSLTLTPQELRQLDAATINFPAIYRAVDASCVTIVRFVRWRSPLSAILPSHGRRAAFEHANLHLQARN
jgi:diketogulonate reductase-like aldo/keto reductase